MRYLNKITILILIMLALTMGGCDQGYDISTRDDNNLIVFDKGIVKFSFEYSSLWRKDKVNIGHDTTNIDLKAPFHEGERYDSFIGVFVQRYPQPSDIITADRQINRVKGYPDFHLLERKSIEVANMPAEEIVYFHNAPQPDFMVRRGETPIPTVTREVFFSYGQIEWWVTLIYNRTTTELANMYEANFERIIETLKIAE